MSIFKNTAETQDVVSILFLSFAERKHSESEKGGISCLMFWNTLQYPSKAVCVSMRIIIAVFVTEKACLGWFQQFYTL